MNFPPLMREETVIMDEYNHRLFNTIQIISVEIGRCSRISDSTDVRPALSNLSKQVGALAALHRLLATSDSRGVLEDHCRALCGLLLSIFGREDVAIHVNIQDIPLSYEQKSKIALIVVELVTNCLKHSLAGEAGGTIWVDLSKIRGEIEISACDSRRTPVRKSMTPRILGALAESLEGSVFVLDRDGYTAGVRIPYPALVEGSIAPIYGQGPSTAGAVHPYGVAGFGPLCDL